MASENENENEPVEIVERASVTPAGDDEETVDAGDAAEGGAETGDEGEAEPVTRGPKEQIVRRQSTSTTEEDEDDNSNETPREKARRHEIERLKGLIRKDRTSEIMGGMTAPGVPKKELPADKAAVLQKYKPDELNHLREVLPILAEEAGYVRSDQLAGQSYNERASAELDSFLEKHPEYLPENDKDNMLWGQFQNEFAMYRQPPDPKTFKRIFERVHRDVFGIKVAGEGKGATVAAQRKVASASHAGASAPARAVTSTRPKTNTSGLRLDMLKGFSEDEIADLSGE